MSCCGGGPRVSVSFCFCRRFAMWYFIPKELQDANSSNVLKDFYCLGHMTVNVSKYEYPYVCLRPLWTAHVTWDVLDCSYSSRKILHVDIVEQKVD